MSLKNIDNTLVNYWGHIDEAYYEDKKGRKKQVPATAKAWLMTQICKAGSLYFDMPVEYGKESKSRSIIEDYINILASANLITKHYRSVLDENAKLIPNKLYIRSNFKIEDKNEDTSIHSI